jgi:hypothetical protein
MKIIRRALVRLALISVAATFACTFGRIPRAQGPALGAVPPCYAGSICAVPFDGVGFAWMLGAMRAAEH